MKNIVVFDLFADTFGVSRASLSYPNIRLLGLFAVEIDPVLCKASSSYFNTPIPRNTKTLFIQGHLSNPLVQAKLFKELEAVFLKAKANNMTIDGILVTGGPPCTYYSSLQAGAQMRTHRKNPEGIKQNLWKANQFVLSFLMFFHMVKVLASMYFPECTCILVMKNPWSIEYLNIPFPGDSSNKENLQEKIELGLRNRPFLQPWLSANGGPLFLHLFNWCAFDFYKYPKTPTAVFTTMSNFVSRHCNHKQKHVVTVVNTKSKTERAEWPKEFVLLIFHFFAKRYTRSFNFDFEGTLTTSH